MPRLMTITSPAFTSRVSPATVIFTSPSMIAMTCSVCSWLWSGTCFPGSYVTRQSRICSPPIACSVTPSTNCQASTPFQVRNGVAISAICLEEAFAAVRAHRPDRNRVIEDDALAVAPWLLLSVERAQNPFRRRRQLGHPDADGVVDRGHDCRRLRVVRHLADRLRAERPVLGRVLDDQVVDVGQVFECGSEVSAELAATMLRRGVVG